MKILPLKSDILKKDFDLMAAIKTSLQKNHRRIINGDILIISSKLVALSEGRVIDLNSIKPSKKARSKKFQHHYFNAKTDPRIIELIIKEADKIWPGNLITTLKDNILIPSAGIDFSNSPKDIAILWPKNAQKTATALRKILCKIFRIRSLGIIICDSHCTPLRRGTTGIALAWAGFFGIEDERGKKDIYGKPLKVTQKAVADNLSSAALIVMGEANKKIPFVLTRGAPVKFAKRIQKQNEIFVKPKDCIFSGIYSEKVKKDLN